MSRLDRRVARITAIERVDSQALWGRALIEGEAEVRRIIAYPRLTGPLAVGDLVWLNVTATALALGTGGVDFVMGSLTDKHADEPETREEHIIKLRYTPLQHAVAVAEQGPDWDDSATLAGLPVVACLLHSQVALVAAAVKAATPTKRIAYVMTDSAALPLGFSKLVAQLRALGLLDVTLTCGQAFGGERECVTLPSALLAARTAESADVVIVGPGPGNAGTGTRYGFSGIEQAWALRVTTALGGRALCCLRASSADARPRHQGISHHSHTVLALAGGHPEVGWPHDLPLPEGLSASFLLADPEPGLALLQKNHLRVTSMGRTVEQDPLFFRVSAAFNCL
jgi:Protein of unknown function (DUF3866)